MKLKQLLLFVLTIVLSLMINSTLAQRAKIVNEWMSPHRLETLQFTTNSIATGLDVVANQTYVYLSAKNIAGTDPILSAVFTLLSKPAGSATVLENIDPSWVQFLPDVTGAYQVGLSITTASGSHDTTKTIYAANFVGVGNFDGVTATYPNCMTCHQNTPRFIEIFNRWKDSGHANMFKNRITTGPSIYNTDCMKCHTTGYDYNLPASNNGFDDVAAQLGWVWQGPPNAGKWDTLKTQYTGLVNRATVGCESCHGPGGEHAMGGNVNKIQISLESGVCSPCHDSPWRYNKYVQWQNSAHGEPVWSGSFAQGTASQNNNLSNCIRCHDGQGFVNFTNGLTTNTTGWTRANHTHLSCQTCHDPHGNTNTASLRFTPAGSDTLANGFQYTTGGTGQLCFNCHKGRRNADTYSLTQVTSAFWGPHYSVQTDVLLGKNAASFGNPYLSSPHNLATEHSCVTCHMPATTEIGNPDRDKVGGHTFALYNPETNYYHTTSCVPCHGQKNSWDDFIARADYDGNGIIESIPKEVDGLLKALRIALPPAGIDSIAWQMIRDTNDVNINKAYFNYQIMKNEGSKGMHNAMFTFDVLRQSLMAIGGMVSVDDAPITLVEYSLFQNYPNPFNPTTTIRYSLPYESNVKISVYSITGERVMELVNGVQSAGYHQAVFNTSSAGRQLASGVYLYMIEANSVYGNGSFIETKKMILIK